MSLLIKFHHLETWSRPQPFQSTGEGGCHLSTKPPLNQASSHCSQILSQPHLSQPSCLAAKQHLQVFGPCKWLHPLDKALCASQLASEPHRSVSMSTPMERPACALGSLLCAPQALWHPFLFSGVVCGPAGVFLFTFVDPVAWYSSLICGSPLPTLCSIRPSFSFSFVFLPHRC